MLILTLQRLTTIAIPIITTNIIHTSTSIFKFYIILNLIISIIINNISPNITNILINFSLSITNINISWYQYRYIKYYQYK